LTPQQLSTVLAIALLLLLSFFGIVMQSYLALWLRAIASRSRIPLLSLIVMTLKGIRAGTVVDCQVMAIQAGLKRNPTGNLEAHALAGGDIVRVTRAIIAAHSAGINLDWATAAAVDLAGRDVLEAVQTSINPKVIDCPATVNGKRTSISGVAKDGIQLNTRVRVTVRSQLGQLIGGATEATVIARIGQGIVSAIGNSPSYREILANPALIANAVMERGLDSQTAFSIVSIDVEEIAVGENVGATLQLDQAKADFRIAQASAEARRVMAVAVDQEMKALIQENRAIQVLAEAQIPQGISHAYTAGGLRAKGVSSAKGTLPLRKGGSSSLHMRRQSSSR
jgi:uncharacterized protein YqfA (UPF0365 family)